MVIVTAWIQQSLEELWIEFGNRKNKAFYSIHLICNNLISAKYKALIFFLHLLGVTKSVISKSAKIELRGKHRKATHK